MYLKDVKYQIYSIKVATPFPYNLLQRKFYLDALPILYFTGVW